MLLAALFLKEDRFLLIDEPTNHLDMEARQLVSHYLGSKKASSWYPMTALFWITVWIIFCPLTKPELRFKGQLLRLVGQ